MTIARMGAPGEYRPTGTAREECRPFPARKIKLLILKENNRRCANSAVPSFPRLRLFSALGKLVNNLISAVQHGHKDSARFENPSGGVRGHACADGCGHRSCWSAGRALGRECRRAVACL